MKWLKRLLHRHEWYISGSFHVDLGMNKLINYRCSCGAKKARLL